MLLRFARAYGFRNIQNVVRRVKGGTSPYHFVELMACPAGCANGGGQPRPNKLEVLAMGARNGRMGRPVHPQSCTILT